MCIKVIVQLIYYNPESRLDSKYLSHRTQNLSKTAMESNTLMAGKKEGFLLSATMHKLILGWLEQ